MKIREYRPEDAEALGGVFERQGFKYDAPNFSDPALLSKLVVEKDGAAAMAILARLTAEAYFLMDPEFGSPRQKWEAFLALHEASREDCYLRGLEDIYCWVPPEIAKAFGRRLLRLGWEKNLWASYHRQLTVSTFDSKENQCAFIT